MLKFKYLFSNISVINVLLMAVVLFFVAHFLFPLFTMPVKYSLPLKEKTYREDKQTDVAEKNVPSPADFVSISEENLFHPERKIPAEKKEEQPLPKPEFVLSGTVLTDTVSLAYLEDRKAPRNTPGRGKRQTALRLGDSMSGFVLKEIETDKIVMIRGNERLVVHVLDKTIPKARDTAAPAPAVTRAAQQPQRVQQPPSRSRPVVAPPKRPERIETTILPPRNPEEQSIINLFEKGKQNR
jgi:type II secretory pathway component PulC